MVSLVVVLGGAFAYLDYADVELTELSELWSEGPIERLDPTPEAHPGGDRVLLFALDGVGDSTFHEALASGAMPDIAALMGEPGDDDRVREHAWVAPGALSILPSTTVAAWSSTFSGEPVGRTGVPGNEWFVREEMRFLAPAPVSVHGNVHTLRALNDGLIGNAVRVPTVFERLHGRSHVSLMPVYRGADLFTVPDPSGLAALFEAVADGVTGDDTVSGESYGRIDTASIDSVEQAIREHGLPTLQVVYFPGVDLFSHVARNPLVEQQRYLAEVIDPAVERVLTLYREHGELERTWVIFVSDHGHTPVLDDDEHSLGIGTEEDPDEPTALLVEQGFRVRPFEIDADRDDFQAVVAYQGAIAYVYLADRSSCPDEGQRCDWQRAPRLEEDVMPIARAFEEAARGERSFGGLAGALDLVFAREPRPVGQDALPYQVWDGARLVPVREWLASHPRPDLLDLAARMDALSSGPQGNRAGDVLLLARSGLDTPIEDRFYFSGPYRSWHGSPAASDSTITFAIAQPARDGSAIRARIREIAGATPSQLDVTRVILSLAGQ